MRLRLSMLTLALVAILLAAPLAAQQTQTTLVPNVDVTVNGDTIVINVEVMSDSTRLARIADAMEGIAAILEDCGCTQPQGTHPVVRIGQGALVIAAFFIGFQVKGIKENTANNSDGGASGEGPLDSDQYPESK